MKKNIIVVCDDNTLLSKVAEAYLKKYAGYWKNVHSAGLHTNNKKVSPLAFDLLKQEQLEELIDGTIRGIGEYPADSVDYFVTLSKTAFDEIRKRFPDKEVFHIEVGGQEKNEAVLLEHLKKECLAFVKSGPVKRWLDS
jgi:protein-tyrosine-phosphatase